MHSASQLENQAQFYKGIIDRIVNIERAFARLVLTPDWADGFPTYDPRYVNVDGDTMTGLLTLNPAGGLAARIESGDDTGYIDWVPAGGGARIGYLQQSGVGQNSILNRDIAGDLRLRANSGNVRLEAPGGDVRSNASLFVQATDIVLGASVGGVPSLRFHYPGSGDIHYIDYQTGAGADHIFFRANGSSPPTLDLANSYANFGRANHADGWATASGVFIQTAGSGKGRVWSTASAPPNFRAAHIGAGDANGQRFIDFTRGGTGIGWVTQDGTTGVNYGTASDGRFKTDVVDIDDDEALGRVRQLRPVSYRWKCDKDGNACEDGEPTGDVQRGFIAQEVDSIAPWAVSKPIEVPAADDDEQVDPGAWSLDYGKLTPDITAAVQALDRKVTAQQQIIDRQQQQIDALTAKVDALVG